MKTLLAERPLFSPRLLHGSLPGLSILIIFVCLLLTAPPSNAAEIHFTQHSINSTFAYAYTTQAADLDQDGDLDLLGAGFLGLNWWENAQDGNWVEHAIAGEAHSIYVADIDGDNDPDIVTSVSGNSDIVWFENSAGNGSTWVPHVLDWDENYDGVPVYPGDIDRDGDIDILTGITYDEKITWWENLSGDGSTWIEHLVSDNFNFPWNVHMADLDGDNDLDVLSAAHYEHEVTWWENVTGDGITWLEHPIESSFEFAVSVYAADLDGDTDLDVLGGAMTDTITWWENLAGDGTTWLEHTVDENFTRTRSVYAADMDQDNDIDVLATGLGDTLHEGYITWWENLTGDGTTWSRQNLSEDFYMAVSVCAVDMDNDRDLDILGTAADDTGGGDNIAWWENDLITGPTIYDIVINQEIVPQYEKFEVSFQISQSGNLNPFDPSQIQVDGIFTTPNNLTLTQPGFYYQGYQQVGQVNFENPYSANETYILNDQPIWKVRFAPQEIGDYTFHLQATVAGVTISSPVFTFTTSKSTNPGFIGISNDNGRYFEFDNGDPFIGIGLNVGWWQADKRRISTYGYYLTEMNAHQANLARIWMTNSGKRQTVKWVFSLQDENLGNHYNLEEAWAFDQIVELAEQNDVYLLLVLDPVSQYDSIPWADNVYNTTNGGICTYTNQIFHAVPNKPWKQDQGACPGGDPLEFQQRVLRYMIARWGYSTNLFAWELWNEITEIKTPTTWAPEIWDWAVNWDQEIVPWHQVMGSYLDDLDAHPHMVTTSSGSFWEHPDLYSKQELDIAQMHFYYVEGLVDDNSGDPVIYSEPEGHDMADVTQYYATQLFSSVDIDPKPSLIGEFGLVNSGWHPSDYLDEDMAGLYLHDGLWSSLMSGMASANLGWHWQYYLGNDLNGNEAWWQQYAPISRFAQTIDIQGLQVLKPVNVSLTPNPDNRVPSLSSSNSKIRVMGLQNDTSVWAWIQNTDNTWWNYVDDNTPPPIAQSGMVAVTGMIPNTQYTIEWWDTYQSMSSEPGVSYTFVTADSGGKLTLSVTDLLTDTAVKISPFTLTVNSIADPGDGSCDTTECTLREAITLANIHSGTISFNIPGLGPHTIQPTSELPQLNGGIVIDGYTQPGAHPNTNPLELGSNAVLMIELDGSQAGYADGLPIMSEGGSVTIRGLVINRFRGSGIGSDIGEFLPQVGHRFEGNFIGTDVTGMIPLGNGAGINLSGYSWEYVTIGGTTPATRNVISGNGVGVYIGYRYPSYNIIQGNYIGTDATGQTPLPNSIGLTLYGYHNTVGGVEPGTANVISGNTLYAILADDDDSSNFVHGNFIGTDATETVPLGNAAGGIHIHNGYLHIVNNTIAFNGGNGIASHLYGGPVPRLAILDNTIFSNIGLGIDLNNDGITPNDPNDADWLQNFPVLHAAHTDGVNILIEGVLNSNPASPGTPYTLQFFANSTCDPSGNGEGENLLGSLTVTIGSDGNAPFTATLPTAVPPGHWVTATATRGKTSEFSACQVVEELLDTTAPICVWVDTSGPEGLVTFQDTQSGLATIQIAQSRNVIITIPPFAPGTTDGVDATITLINSRRQGQVRFITTDVAGNRVLCNGRIRP